MPTAEEALATQQTPFAAAAQTGVETLSLRQEVVFTRYLRVTLPMDGFVFWVRADQLSRSALMNTSPFNSYTPNQVEEILSDAAEISALGSLHFSSTLSQTPTSTFGASRIIFTSEVELVNLESIASNELYIGTFENFRFAFTSLDSRYVQSGLYHYMGSTINPDMETQIVDYPATLNTRDVIVSNSLPIWLTLNILAPIYPSYLVPENATPPYVVINIPEDRTEALQAVPYTERNSSRWQLVKDTVQITTIGLRNDQAADLMDLFLDYMMNHDDLGLMNTPVIRDSKHNAPEIRTLSQMKTMEFVVSYFQSRVRDTARRLIARAIPGYTIAPVTP